MTTTSADTAPWPDDMILTEAHARWLMGRGACADALGYVGQTVAAAAEAAPWAAMRFAPDRYRRLCATA